MRKIEKPRGTSPNQRSWKLDAKISDAVAYWGGHFSDEDGTTCLQNPENFYNCLMKEFPGYDNGEDSISFLNLHNERLPFSCEQRAADARSYMNTWESRWSDPRPRYLSTNWVTQTSFEMSDSSRDAVKDFLDYCLTNYWGDFVRFTLQMTDSRGIMRSTKWQGHLVEEEVALVAHEVVAEF